MTKKYMVCKLDNIDDALENLYEEYDITDYIIDVDESNDKINVFGYRVIIPEIGYSVREGVYLCEYEDEDELVADFALSLIYYADEEDPSKYLYWEQDGIEVSLHNFLSIADEKDKTKNLGQLNCKIELEEAGDGK